jgi:HEAT repeat protein
VTCPCASPAKRPRARHGLAVLLAIVVTVGLAPHALAQSNTAASTFLTASDPFVREDARRVLIGRAPDSLPTFEAALTSRALDLRVLAAQSLVAFRTPRARDLLLACLDDDAAVKTAALKALAEFESVPCDPRILDAAASPLWSVRRAAALALAKVDDARAATQLERLAQDDDVHVQEAALRALCASDADGLVEALARTLQRVETATDREHIVDRLRSTNVGAHRGVITALRLEIDRRVSMRTAAFAAEALSRQGHMPIDDATLSFLTAAATQGDPATRGAAVRSLRSIDPNIAAPVVLNRLRTASDPEAEILADLALGLLGPDAMPPLTALALGQDPATSAARAAAIHTVRRFGAHAPLDALAWSYAVELPRAVREDLLAAFEEHATSHGGRSGLFAVLEDPDSNLRLRAFRALCEAREPAEDESDWLMAHVASERSDSTRKRMSRLLATHARGLAAQRFANLLVTRLRVPDPYAREARDALENIGDPTITEDVTRAVTEAYSPPYDLDLLRLFTRLKSAHGDAIVAERLREFVAADAVDDATTLLRWLRVGGGAHVASAIREALSATSPDIAHEALRTLLQRGDPSAFDALVRVWTSTSTDEKGELLNLLADTPGPATPDVLRRIFALEDDHELRATLVQKIGDARAPLTDLLVPLTKAGEAAELRAHAVDALSMLDDDAARAAVRAFFVDVEHSRDPSHPDDEVLWLTAVRAVCRIGWLDAAPRLSTDLFARRDELVRRTDSMDGGFAHEETVLRALTELATTVEQPELVCAALEVEIDARRDDGSLYLLPKLLFFRLAAQLGSAHAEFQAARREFLELALRLPPHHDRRELSCCIDLAERAYVERDPERAAQLYAHAVTLMDLFDVDAGAVLEGRLGSAAPLVGFDARERLRAEAHLARAIAAARRGDGRAERAALTAATRCAPDDVWFALDAIDSDDAADARERLRALPVARVFDGDWLEAVAALAQRVEAHDVADAARNARQRLVDAGLVHAR